MREEERAICSQIIMAVKDVSYIFEPGATYSFESICEIVVKEGKGVLKGTWENFIKKRRDNLFDFMKHIFINIISATHFYFSLDLY